MTDKGVNNLKAISQRIFQIVKKIGEIYPACKDLKIDKSLYSLTLFSIIGLDKPNFWAYDCKYFLTVQS